MKKIYLVLTLILFVGQLSFAQNEFTPNTGDSQLDKELKERNAKAKENISEFKKKMGSEFSIQEDKVEEIMNKYKMEPADTYMALKVAKLSGKTPDAVGESFEKNKGKGWGVIAKEMGIKPGSAEFQQLKAGQKGQGGNGKADKAKGGKPDKGDKGKGKKDDKGGAKEKAPSKKQATGTDKK